MQTIQLNGDWVDLHVGFGVAKTSMWVLQNSSSHRVHLVVSQTKPETAESFNENRLGTIVEPGESTIIPATTLTVWIFGIGQVGITSRQESFGGDYVLTDLPADVWTSDADKFRRLRVDVGQTGFFEAREFRLVRKVSVVAGTPLVFRFTSAVDFILFEQTLNCSEGDLEFYAWRADQGTAGGPFTPIPVAPIAKNTSSTFRPYSGVRYQSQTTISTGGTFTPTNPLTYVDYDRAKTSGATAQQTSVSGGDDTVRYLAAGTYYLVLTSLSGTSVGRFSLAWEERPT
jgi:hypothetical protein